MTPNGGKGHFEAVEALPGPPVPGRFINWRMVDQVRSKALECAVELVKSSTPRPDESDTARATRVVHVATMLEPYLTGEEANGAVQRG